MTIGDVGPPHSSPMVFFLDTTMEKEIFAPIKGYEGLYQISSYGRVKSKYNRTKSGFIKQQKNHKGYLVVWLSKNGKDKGYLVHRLVGEAFLPNWFDDTQINHLDENKENNNIDNLEWCSNEYNHNYGTRNERAAKANTNGKCSKKVLQFSLSGEFIREWPSASECERNGYSRTHVSSCCRGERKTHKGFRWEYK